MCLSLVHASHLQKDYDKDYNCIVYPRVYMHLATSAGAGFHGKSAVVELMCL